MNEKMLQKFLDVTKGLAVEAGKAIVPIAVEVGEVETKEDGSPLTRADRASHEVITAGLAKLKPRFPVLSEEGDLEQEGMGEWRCFWCVDPLDGTKEFVKGLDEYTVNIALIEDSVAILGVIYVPALDVLYYASQGLGAWKVEPGSGPAQVHPSDTNAPVVAVASRSHLSEDTEEFLKRLGVKQMVSSGSSLKICAVAEGRADLYPRHGPTCLWDTAAGSAIALAAGCKVIDLQGTALSYDPGQGIKRPGFIVYPKGLETLVQEAL
jgi:3'(2'), 5'-bisphosphate nucleotidase